MHGYNTTRAGRWGSALLGCWVLMTVGCATRPAPVTTVSEAEPPAIRAYFAGQGKVVLTFLGFSGAGYERPDDLLSHAARILDRHDPQRTIVNAGATPDGIGAVYELAWRRGFPTTGIVSVLARGERVPLSPWVETVFYVRDDRWGGFLPGTQILSPTSHAMVENSDVLVAIGGGDVARDELMAARRAGKSVAFIPTDSNHALARAKARRSGLPAPTDFTGTAASAMTPLR